MSTILTNGLKLPDKGSVDWYADMQNNYTILDGAVGTVAEHTTALAGKAPAVHTHTKSDVTDLFNSANTWSALNSYSNGQIRIKSQNQEIGVIPSSGVIQYLEFADKNDAQHGIVGLWDYAGGASEIQMYISDKFKNGTKDPTGTSDSTFLSFGFKADGSKFLAFSGQVDNSVIPKSNNSYDLGTSSYQWNNLYASKIKQFDSFSSYADVYQVLDSSNNRIVSFRITKGATKNTLGINVHDQNNSAPKGLVIENDLSNNITITGGGTNNYLGTSTNKWKTFNGINPGALSLPDTYINLDTTDWDLTGQTFTYVSSIDGWLFINVRPNNNYAYVAIEAAHMRNNSENTTGKNAMACIAVRATVQASITLIGASIAQARLVKCAGNV